MINAQTYGNGSITAANQVGAIQADGINMSGAGVQIVGTISAGNVQIQCTLDGENFLTFPTTNQVDPSDEVTDNEIDDEGIYSIGFVGVNKIRLLASNDFSGNIKYTIVTSIMGGGSGSGVGLGG